MIYLNLCEVLLGNYEDAHIEDVVQAAYNEDNFPIQSAKLGETDFDH